VGIASSLRPELHEARGVEQARALVKEEGQASGAVLGCATTPMSFPRH
jgi:hypothetical protein